LRDDIIATFDRLSPLSRKLGTAVALGALEACVDREMNGAGWLRERYAETRSYPDVVRMQAEHWAKD
jgi:gamma-glutamyl:cysteine ligase YbdK (ATP-grasp superfamily)